MTSKFKSITQELEKAIRSGSLKKGDKLPSIRQLSQDFHCSKDTAQRALFELKYRNLIYAVDKSGYYVLEDQQDPQPQLDFNLQAYNQLAFSDFKTCLSESLVGRETDLFNYQQEQQGLSQLLNSLQQHLFDRAIYTKADKLVVTSGTQQALYILSQMSFPNHKSHILLEQPTYHRMNSLVKDQGLPYLTIQRGFTGLDFQALEELFKSQSIKFFYTISRISNPLGLSYSPEEKKRLVELANRYDVYIVEDDYMGDFTQSDNLPLHYYDTQDHVIYLKSFSSTLFPALRLGMSVLPLPILKSFLAYKALMDYDTSLIMQKALSLYLDNGMFDKNLAKLSSYFKDRQASAQKLCKQLPDDLSYQVGPKFLSIKLPHNLLALSKAHNFPLVHPASSLLGEISYLQLANDQDLEENLRQVIQLYHAYTKKQG